MKLKKLTKTSYSIHHWLGLFAGIFLLIASVTGSVLVFHKEIDSLQFAEQHHLEEPASELRMETSLEQIRAAHPEADIRVPDFPEDHDKALKYEIRSTEGRKWVFVHPESGKQLATVEHVHQRFVHVLLNLHYNLYAGTLGKIFVFLGGLSLIMLSITGLIFYRRSMLKVLTFRQRISFKSRRSFYSSLHRVLGVWSLVFNLLISITGSYIAYTIVEAALLAKTPPARGETTAPPLTAIPVDNALEQVRADFPEFNINYLRFPPGNSGNFSVLGNLNSDPSWYGRTSSYILADMDSGAVTEVQFLQQAPWYTKLAKMMIPLHFGDFAGLPLKIIYSFFGIFPGILAVSGFFIWQKRRKKSPVKRSVKRLKSSSLA